MPDGDGGVVFCGDDLQACEPFYVAFFVTGDLGLAAFVELKEVIKECLVVVDSQYVVYKDTDSEPVVSLLYEK